MKVERRDGAVPREVLTAMIVSTPVLATIASQWEQSGLFGTKHEDVIGGWCVSYFSKYKKAPGPAIETAFRRWADGGRADKDTVSLVEEFLRGLDGQYRRRRDAVNPAFVIDVAAEHFAGVRLRRLSAQIAQDMALGDTAAAAAHVDQFRRIEVGAGAEVNLFSSSARGEIQSAFENIKDDVVIRTGLEDLDLFFGDTLCREGFIAFMAKEKGRKSFWVQELAFLAATRNKKKVAFIECGDQSKKQLLRRLGARSSYRPFKPDNVRLPLSMKRTMQNGLPVIEYEDRGSPPPITYQEAQQELERIGREAGEFNMKVSVHSNSSLSVPQLQVILERWERQDHWHPDVICIDYADILAPIDGTSDTRDQINATWKALRRLSQDWHALVVTATQADAGSYDAPLLTRRNFSEDKRKYGHVTGMVGINQRPEEEENQVLRLNWVIPHRDSDFSSTRCVYTAGCLAVANPACAACW